MIYQAAMRGAAGASTFSPDDIAGLQLWLDASDASTITESGGAVSQWDDKSGNGYHVTQGTAADQPTTGTRTINGLNALDFDNDDLSRAAIVDNPYTVLAVVETDNVTSNTYFWGAGNEGLGFSNVSTVRLWESGALNGSTTVSTGTPYLVVGAYGTGAANTLYLDGSSEGSATLTSVVSNQATVGAFNANNDFSANGKIGELLVYSSVLPTADRQAVENYLASKWGVTLS